MYPNPNGWIGEDLPLVVDDTVVPPPGSPLHVTRRKEISLGTPNDHRERERRDKSNDRTVLGACHGAAHTERERARWT